MKTKQLIWALSFTVLCATAQVGCSSKPSDKAEDVQEKKEDVVEAQERGDTADVRDDQTKLDSARADYKDAVKDSIKDKNQ